jgi:hypothetical protein
LDGAVDGVQEIGPDIVDFDGVAEPCGECFDDGFGVVAGAVEAAVDGVLETDAQRVEQCATSTSTAR